MPSEMSPYSKDYSTGYAESDLNDVSSNASVFLTNSTPRACVTVDAPLQARTAQITESIINQSSTGGRNKRTNE
jgi:hypothetical protein